MHTAVFLDCLALLACCLIVSVSSVPTKLISPIADEVEVEKRSGNVLARIPAPVATPAPVPAADIKALSSKKSKRRRSLRIRGPGPGGPSGPGGDSGPTGGPGGPGNESTDEHTDVGTDDSDTDIDDTKRSTIIPRAEKSLARREAKSIARALKTRGHGPGGSSGHGGDSDTSTDEDTDIDDTKRRTLKRRSRGSSNSEGGKSKGGSKRSASAKARAITRRMEQVD